ncbi:NADPH:quinone reductase [Rhizobium leguminosarum]|uniref:NADPH:quinone reductase n=1 Tax=Rhizobium leguminosarum TaxID=384 RepID=UPI00143F86B2|nr:NADPH:quinone reductase [Rhizobium leguminosarum]NKL21771.1 zinc-binding dehydrogenase [Rhizobium leguminosarum bv. viciae]
MKAAFYEKQGDAKTVLQVGALPDPMPGPGEVRVFVRVSSVNPTDLKARAGYGGAPMAFPRIVPHQDGAGIIDDVGEGVPASRIGERVWLYEAQAGRPTGTAAQYTIVPAERAVPLPDNVSFETGACLGIPALTAHRCLFADGDVRGKRILVQGGAGAVGTAAILLAKWAGAWVATTISRPEQANIAKEAGADLVINRRTDDISTVIMMATGGGGIDRIVEVDLAANIQTDLLCIATNGVISSYAAADPKEAVALPALKAMLKAVLIRFVFVYSVPSDAKQAGVDALTKCLQAGAYAPAIAARYSLDEIAAAHEAQESGKLIGKILVTTD